MKEVLSLRISAKDACHSVLRKKNGELVRLPHSVHTAIISPTGGGKGVSCIIPFLLSNSESAVVLDFKGENYRITAKHRQKKFRHRIVALDPFNVVTKQPDTFNPLDFIKADSPTAIDECNSLANALIVRTGDEKEPHWNDSAEAFVAGISAFVVRHADAEQRSLQAVKQIISHPKILQDAIQAMCEDSAWGGMLSRLGGQLSRFVGNELGSVMTTTARHTRFLDTVAIAASTTTSSFDPSELPKGRMTVYLILPPEHIRSQSALLRMWIGSLLKAVVRNGLVD